MGGHEGQTDEYNRAGVQKGNRPKRKGARTVQNGSAKVILLGGGRIACMGEGENEKYCELRDGTHRGQGQERELCPILHLVGEALHCSTPPTQKRPRQKKRNTQTEVKKSGLERGWCGRFKKKTTDTRLVVDL